ncbi:MAG: response regulator [Candidatus Brocadiaceae bacterium]|nr:response regulator [Candidatus Brocadiaceae bacterium]
MKTVLVVEDNVNNMELITVILVKNGYNVIKAETGQKGLDTATELRLDFIILDIQLPDMDGLEVLQMIRSSKINENIPVIAMTSFAMAGDRQKMMNKGFNGYVEKPIEPEKVINQINKIIGES